jgi:hypothetical protein
MVGDLQRKPVAKNLTAVNGSTLLLCDILCLTLDGVKRCLLFDLGRSEEMLGYIRVLSNQETVRPGYEISFGT